MSFAPPRRLAVRLRLAIAAALAVATSGCGGNETSADPCAGIDCGGHGTCYTDGVWALCACEPGWRPAGTSCVPEGDVGDVPREAGDADDGGDVADVPGCDPSGADDHCVEGVRFRCRADGSGFDGEPCRWGCDPAGRRCGELRIPNLGDPGLLDAGTGRLFPAGATEPYVVLDTDTGAITTHDADGNLVASLRLPVSGLDPVTGIHFVVRAQGAGHPGLGVFSMSDLAIPEGLTVVGKGANALVLLVSVDVDIAGTLTVAARAAPWIQEAGPGGGAGGGASPPSRGSGPGGGAPGDEDGSVTRIDTGGGGGGHGGSGGAGGDTSSGTLGGAGGVFHGTAVLEPLTGGSGGGSGGDTGNRSGSGGPGGGALELVAGGNLVVRGRIDAGGGGGRGGRGGALYGAGPGGGGGSGGSILLQAPTIRVSGVVAANGGGGGGGGHGVDAGNAGQDGQGSLVAARGGTGARPGENDGGAGGAGDHPDGHDAPDVAGSSLEVHTGGGGGAAGILRFNGRDVDLDGATLSPSPASARTTIGPLPTE